MLINKDAASSAPPKHVELRTMPLHVFKWHYHWHVKNGIGIQAEGESKVRITCNKDCRGWGYIVMKPNMNTTNSWSAEYPQGPGSKTEFTIDLTTSDQVLKIYYSRYAAVGPA